MEHSLTKNDAGRPVVETFENENVKITRFLNGDVETKIKPIADPKVKRMYIELNKSIKKGDI
jgi:hypothetical protein